MSRTEYRPDTRTDLTSIHLATVKRDVSISLKTMDKTLKRAVRLHNQVGRKVPEDEEEKEDTPTSANPSARPEVGRVRPKSAAPPARKAAPGKAAPASGGPRPRSAAADRNVNAKIFEMRMKEKPSSLPAARPTSAPHFNPAATDPTSAASLRKSQPRPISAAQLTRARDQNTPITERALLVMTLLGSPAGNTLAATLMTKAVRAEIRRLSKTKREAKQKKFKEKRVDNEKKRIDEILAKDWNLRMEKLKEMGKTAQDKERRTQGLLVYE